MKLYQICVECDQRTGHTEEDILDVGDLGPLCEECFAEHKCRTCWGEGEYRVLRDPITRQLDYIRGVWAGEMATCDRCEGYGYV